MKDPGKNYKKRVDSYNDAGGKFFDPRNKYHLGGNHYKPPLPAGGGKYHRRNISEGLITENPELKNYLSPEITQFATGANSQKGIETGSQGSNPLPQQKPLI